MRLALLAALVTGVSAHAEFLHVRMEVNGSDCPICVKSLEIGLRKTRGISKITVTALRGAEFTLAKNNRVTLEQLRDAIESSGLKSHAAYVVARGKPLTSGGRWQFAVEGLENNYGLSAKTGEVMKAMREHDNEIITIDAESAPTPDARTSPVLEATGIAK